MNSSSTATQCYYLLTTSNIFMSQFIINLERKPKNFKYIFKLSMIKTCTLNVNKVPQTIEKLKKACITHFQVRLSNKGAIRALPQLS